jgi:MFS family permease
MTNWQIIRWWELRRLLYNTILFAIGITSIFVMELLMEKVIPVGEDAIEPMALALGVVAYGIMANVCYTLGWIVELIGRRQHEARARLRAKKLFLMGLWFSCLLTSAPSWFGLVFWLTHRGR